LADPNHFSAINHQGEEAADGGQPPAAARRVRTPEEIGADTLLERLTSELHASAALVAHPILLSAWATTGQAAPPEQELGYFATAPTP
jgi:hypothetical protein